MRNKVIKWRGLRKRGVLSFLCPPFFQTLQQLILLRRRNKNFQKIRSRHQPLEMKKRGHSVCQAWDRYRNGYGAACWWTLTFRRSKNFATKLFADMDGKFYHKGPSILKDGMFFMLHAILEDPRSFRCWSEITRSSFIILMLMDGTLSCLQSWVALWSQNHQ